MDSISRKWNRSVDEMSAEAAAVGGNGSDGVGGSVEAQRWICVILDVSESMREREDLQPNRLIYCLRVVLRFIQNFFERHPLSQMQLILTANGVATSLSTLSGSVIAHTDALKGVLRQSTNAAPSQSSDSDFSKHILKGVVSLQNALLLALRTLQGGSSLLPGAAAASLAAGSKEVILIMSSLATQDPANIFTTVEKLRKASIFAHVFHIGADLYICRYLAERTHGTYCVALSGDHFASELMKVIDNTPVDANRSSAAVNYGVRQLPVGFCSPINVGESQEEKLQRCPKCLTPVEHGFDSRSDQHVDSASPAVATLRALGSPTALPTNCHVCGLLLVKPSHLIRSTLTTRQSASLIASTEENLEDANCGACGMDLVMQSMATGDLMAAMQPTTDKRKSASTTDKAAAQQQCGICHSHFCASCAEMITLTLFFCPCCK
jgi:transcription initiation factor TFIIH subunit 2